MTTPSGSADHPGASSRALPLPRARDAGRGPPAPHRPPVDIIYYRQVTAGLIPAHAHADRGEEMEVFLAVVRRRGSNTGISDPVGSLDDGGTSTGWRCRWIAPDLSMATLRVIERMGVPRSIVVQRPEVASLPEPLAELGGIELQPAEWLEGIEIARRSMLSGFR